MVAGKLDEPVNMVKHQVIAQCKTVTGLSEERRWLAHQACPLRLPGFPGSGRWSLQLPGAGFLATLVALHFTPVSK